MRLNGDLIIRDSDTSAARFGWWQANIRGRGDGMGDFRALTIELSR